MQRLISALQPSPAYWDAKHTAARVQSPLTCQCAFTLHQRSAEPKHDQLPYTASSRKHPARQHEHFEPMASIGNRASVLQAARTRSIHAERCLPVHAGQRRQHDSAGAWPSGSPNSLRAESREIGSLLAELNPRVEVTPGLNQPFFAFTWLRLPPYARSSRAPRLLSGWAIHAPQVDLPAVLATRAPNAASMTRHSASGQQPFLARSEPEERLAILGPSNPGKQTLIPRGAYHG